jgi:hypothetical protein
MARQAICAHALRPRAPRPWTARPPRRADQAGAEGRRAPLRLRLRDRSRGDPEPAQLHLSVFAERTNGRRLEPGISRAKAERRTPTRRRRCSTRPPSASRPCSRPPPRSGIAGAGGASRSRRKSSCRSPRLRRLGHRTTLSYLRAVSELTLANTTLLPHLNPGLMSERDLASLRETSVSMAIMLASTSTRLLARRARSGARRATLALPLVRRQLSPTGAPAETSPGLRVRPGTKVSLRAGGPRPTLPAVVPERQLRKLLHLPLPSR